MSETKTTFTRREMLDFLDDFVKNDDVPADFDVNKMFEETDVLSPFYRASLLLYACKARKPLAINKLIEYGADPNVVNNYDERPLDMLAWYINPFAFAPEILVLLQAGSQIRADEKCGDFGTLCNLIDSRIEYEENLHYYLGVVSCFLTGLQKYIISLCNEKCDYHVSKVIVAHISVRTIEYTFVLDLVIGDW